MIWRTAPLPSSYVVLWLYLHNQDLSVEKLQPYKNMCVSQLRQALFNTMFSYESTHPDH